jgi:hypothetical protein
MSMALEITTLLAERDEAPKHIANAIDATREELATMRAAVERCAELEAEFAKVTAERDEARRMAEIRLRAIESIRHASLRATPTEGETK